MKKITLGVLLSICFTLSSFSQPLSGDYTVGPGADYETVTTALQDLQAEGVGNGGAIFTIAPGTYNDSVIFENISGITEDNPLTFTAEPGTVTF